MSRLSFLIDGLTHIAVADHTDFGCDDNPAAGGGSRGLEVWYPPKETWIPVPPRKALM